jgi:glutamyl-tRNA(Gln) amidotransferase subunit E
VVRTLTDTLVELVHEGIDVEPLEDHHFEDIFKHLAANAFAKEAVLDIVRFLANNPELGVEKAVAELGLSTNTHEVEKLIEDIVRAKKEFIREKGDRAVGPLMGVVMKELRGKVDGKVLNKILAEKVKAVLEEG